MIQHSTKVSAGNEVKDIQVDTDIWSHQSTALLFCASLLHLRTLLITGYRNHSNLIVQCRVISAAQRKRQTYKSCITKQPQKSNKALQMRLRLHSSNPNVGWAHADEIESKTEWVSDWLARLALHQRIAVDYFLITKGNARSSQHSTTLLNSVAHLCSICSPGSSEEKSLFLYPEFEDETSCRRKVLSMQMTGQTTTATTSGHNGNDNSHSNNKYSYVVIFTRQHLLIFVGGNRRRSKASGKSPRFDLKENWSRIQNPHPKSQS